MNIHIDNQAGLNSDGVQVEQKTDIQGRPCFRAWITPTHIFGHEVDCRPIEGYGRTEEEAIERLNIKVRKFYDSLWAEF